MHGKFVLHTSALPPRWAVLVNVSFSVIPELRSSCVVQVLKLHVVPGAAPANLLTSGEKLSTLSGTSVTVHEAGSQTKFSDGRSIAAVTTPDVTSCKGVVHIIDTVLVAPSMLASTTQASNNDDGAAATDQSSGNDAAAATNESTDKDDAATGSQSSDGTAAPVPAPATTDTGSGNGETHPDGGTGTDPEPQPTGRPDYSVTGVKPGSDGKWRVCAGNWANRDEWRRPCGFSVATNGKVTYVSFLPARTPRTATEPSNVIHASYTWHRYTKAFMVSRLPSLSQNGNQTVLWHTGSGSTLVALTATSQVILLTAMKTASTVLWSPCLG